MRVSKTYTQCGKPRDPKIKSIPYCDDDDLDTMSILDQPTHRGVFCSQECRITFIEELDPERTDDELLAEVQQFRKK